MSRILPFLQPRSVFRPNALRRNPKGQSFLSVRQKHRLPHRTSRVRLIRSPCYPFEPGFRKPHGPLGPFAISAVALMPCRIAKPAPFPPGKALQGYDFSGFLWSRRSPASRRPLLCRHRPPHHLVTYPCLLRACPQGREANGEALHPYRKGQTGLW